MCSPSIGEFCNHNSTASPVHYTCSLCGITHPTYIAWVVHVQRRRGSKVCPENFNTCYMCKRYMHNNKENLRHLDKDCFPKFYYNKFFHCRACPFCALSFKHPGNWSNLEKTTHYENCRQKLISQLTKQTLESKPTQSSEATSSQLASHSHYNIYCRDCERLLKHNFTECGCGRSNRTDKKYIDGPCGGGNCTDGQFPGYRGPTNSTDNASFDSARFSSRVNLSRGGFTEN